MTREEFYKLCITDPVAATDKFMELQKDMDELEIYFHTDQLPTPLDLVDDEDVPF